VALRAEQTSSDLRRLDYAVTADGGDYTVVGLEAEGRAQAMQIGRVCEVFRHSMCRHLERTGAQRSFAKRSFAARIEGLIVIRLHVPESDTSLCLLAKLTSWQLTASRANVSRHNC
jgi:hypothetical protein